MTETDRVPVPREVFEGIEAVRCSGLTNMLDRDAVAHIAEEMGFDASARWVRENHDLYARHLLRLRPDRGDAMTDVPFHATRLGRTYYEHTLPRLTDELARINATLVELIEAIDRNGKPRWPNPSVTAAPDSPTERGSHGATPMNPNP